MLSWLFILLYPIKITVRSYGLLYAEIINQIMFYHHFPFSSHSLPMYSSIHTIAPEVAKLGLHLCGKGALLGAEVLENDHRCHSHSIIIDHYPRIMTI